MTGAGHGQQTLSQQRAAYALKEVRAIVGQSFAKEFRSYAANLPPMIQMNGFGQALAFCHSKSDAAYRELYRIVSGWLIRIDQPYHGHSDVLDGITTESMSVYRLAQTEALALLDWVKRFASAYLRTEDTEEGTSAAAPEDDPAGAGSS